MIKQELYDHSIDVLKLAAKMSDQYYQKPLIICYSGGKDSDVLLQLAIESGISFEVQHSHTTVDAPETVYYVREKFKELNEKGIKTTVLKPHYKDGRPITMWNLIVKKGIPPTRFKRYCCQHLKETSTPNRFVALGVREAESNNRKGRGDFENREPHKDKKIHKSLEETQEVYEDAQIYDEVFDCKFIELAKQNKDLICNPIYYWIDEDVWDFIRDRGMKYNPLYDRGYTRVGCVGCCMMTYKKVIQSFNDYPKYKQLYINAFDRLDNFRITPRPGQTKGEAIFDWWLQTPEHFGQISFDEEIGDD